MKRKVFQDKTIHVEECGCRVDRVGRAPEDVVIEHCLTHAGASRPFQKLKLPGIKSADNPQGLDPECFDLCTAINQMPGLTTYESCCGHGTRPFMVWVMARTMNDLAGLLYWLDNCHTGVAGWQMIAYTDCAGTVTRFRIEGPVGEIAYRDAEHIAKFITGNVEQEKR